MRYALPWLAYAACTWAAAAEPPRPAAPNPAAPSTNETSFASLDLTEYRTTPPSFDPITRYQQELGPSSLTFMDRFGPAAQLNWIRLTQDRGYGIHSAVTDAGQGGVSDTLVNAFRETGVALLPLDQWEEIPSDIIEGSLGNTPEERVKPASPAYGPAEISWWQHMREDGFIQYGFRPFRTNPYVYASAIWRDRYNEPILFAHIRCYYSIAGSDKIEGQISIPLSRTWMLTAGGRFAPSKLDGDPSTRSLSVRLERSVSLTSPFHGFMFVGARFDAAGSNIECGWSTPL